MIPVFVDTFFPNGSPLHWRQTEDGAVELYPIPDHARFSPNRQFTHWHLRLHVPPGTPPGTLAVRIAKLMNCWNGREAPAMSRKFVRGVVSADGIAWSGLDGCASDREGFAAEFAVPVAGGVVHFATLVPYTEADLERLLARLGRSPLARVYNLGSTVEGRALPFFELGRADAPESVFLRARAHPWETGGSWLIEGLVDRLLDGSAASRALLDGVRFCVQPMANRDGVNRGMSRFTVTGMDLNRDWHPAVPHDPVLAPENAVLALWFAEQHRLGRIPRLAIDLHNDDGGNLHFSHPARDPETFAALQARFEELLREHTWFTEGHTASGFHNAGTFGEGLSEQYGINAFIWELRATQADGLGRQPLAADWKQLGAAFVEVAARYLRETA